MSTGIGRNWKCGDCGKQYTTEELMKLAKVVAVKEDMNPKQQHGYLSVCTCGYVFHRDKWKLKFEFKLNPDLKKGYVSTVFLELNYSGDWYETMIFIEDLECNYQERYVTKEEAKKGHREVVRKIENKQYVIDKENKDFTLCGGPEE